MKLTAELNKAHHQISLERERDRVLATIDGRDYEVSVREVAHGVYVLINDGHVYECRVENDTALPGAFKVHLRNRTIILTLTDPRRLRSMDRLKGHDGAGLAQIKSPMAGKIVRVLVEPGATVKAGDGIVVVEAMKMQNELKSPRDGVVKEIRAVAGATTNAGEVLAIIEGVSDGG